MRMYWFLETKYWIRCCVVEARVMIRSSYVRIRPQYAAHRQHRQQEPRLYKIPPNLQVSRLADYKTTGGIGLFKTHTGVCPHILYASGIWNRLRVHVWRKCHDSPARHPGLYVRDVLRSARSSKFWRLLQPGWLRLWLWGEDSRTGLFGWRQGGFHA